MNVLFCTQSESLGLFHQLAGALAQRTPIGAVGFTLADSLAYGRFIARHPEFERAGYSVLKEWEVTSQRSTSPDLNLLARYERELGTDAGLFGALVADRRLYMGPDCTYTEDYRRRFSDRELLSILQNAVLSVEQLFERVQPQLVMGFICVTMIDYLVYLFARRRGVRYLNLRPTRVGNRVTLASILNDPAPEFVEAYRHALDDGSPHAADARQYIRRVREQHGRYEGVVKPSAAPALQVNASRRSIWQAGGRAIANFWRYRTGPAAGDNHVPNPLRALYFGAVLNPMRAKRAARELGPRYLRQEILAKSRYAFYPLHTEPEVSLLVYGRPFVNQIEIVRALAMSLPADMILVVKEHPWMVGKRSMDSYRALLNIPRVHLVRPDLDARELILGSTLVAVVTGSVALEAAMLGKPVVTFGDCPYNALPPTMVQRCSDLRALPALLSSMIRDYASDERALEAYLAATFDTSEGINLYSTLLQKKGVYSEGAIDEPAEIAKLAEYTIRTLGRPAISRDGAPAAAARW
jgi:hypothetical protein